MKFAHEKVKLNTEGWFRYKKKTGLREKEKLADGSVL